MFVTEIRIIMLFKRTFNKNYLEARATKLITDNDSDDVMPIFELKAPSVSMMVFLQYFQNLLQKYECKKNHASSIVSTPKEQRSPELALNETKKNHILEDTIKKLNKEKLSLRNLKEEIIHNEKISIKTVENLTKKVKELKGNEEILSKKLIKLQCELR